jgi:hypothetical protein
VSRRHFGWIWIYQFKIIVVNDLQRIHNGQSSQWTPSNLIGCWFWRLNLSSVVQNLLSKFTGDEEFDDQNHFFEVFINHPESQLKFFASRGVSRVYQPFLSKSSDRRITSLMFLRESKCDL